MLIEVVMADYRKGYQFNVAPLVVRNMIILGPATNEAGANCWVNAYDVNTGKEIFARETTTHFLLMRRDGERIRVLNEHSSHRWAALQRFRVAG